MHLIKELLTVEHWDYLVGLDDGASATQSVTLDRYGVRGFPTLVIIDRQGRVVLNSADRESPEQVATAMKATAEEIGLPWPVEKDADQEEIGRRLRRYHEYMMTREITKALVKE